MTDTLRQVAAPAAAEVGAASGMIERLQRKIKDYDRWFLFLDAQMRVLERERQKLSAVVTHTDAGVLVLDGALRAVWSNEQVRVAPESGDVPGSVEGVPCWRIVCGQSGPCSTCPAAHTLATGSVGHREVRQDSGGRPRHIYATSMPIKSLDGLVQETIVMLQDVSDLDVLRLSEEALRASEEHYRLLVESIDVLPWEFDIGSDVFTYVGPQAVRLLGYPVEDWYARGFFAAHIHPDDRERALAECAVASAENRDHELEYRMQSADGRTVWMRDLVSVVPDRGEVGRAKKLRGFMVDVTRAKLDQEALKENEARKGAILEASLDAIISIDSHGVVTEFNAAAGRLSGWKRSEAVGRPLADVLLPEGERNRFEALRTALAIATEHGRDSGRARVGARGAESVSMLVPRAEPANGLRFEMMARRRDGTPVSVEVALTRIQIPGPPEFTAFVRDLSERRRAEETLRARDEQLRQSQKMEALGLLAGGIAHDFNNILTGILGHAELIHQSGSADDRVGRSAVTIETAAHRAADLTRKLLDFSRREPKAMSVDLHRLIDETIGLMERTLEKNIVIRREEADDAPWALVDPGQIQQVILNLAVNARDAMPEGGTLTFSIRRLETEPVPAGGGASGAAGAGMLRLSVRDTGCGMSEEVRHRIFEPLFTTKERGKGTGMGLAMAYSIVTSHGGSVRVESSPGAGSVFHIDLPATGERPREAARQRRSEAPAVGAGRRVLVVDDDDVVRELTARCLQQLGYDVLTATDGQDALDVYRSATPKVDLVFLDLAMPRMGGRDAWRCLRQIDPGVRALLTSGYGCNAEAQELLAEGMSGFVQKPFDLAGLAGMVAEALARP